MKVGVGTSRSAATPRSFAQRLVAWQRRDGRHDLPWQRTRDPYRIWVAEIMLQQTQVATVIPYYERFIATFPDVGTLAAAPLDRVLECWSGLGYYRRAHHLHAAAKLVAARPGAAFPRDVDSIAALPGVGRSTAAAIAAFAFGERAAILDGNVKRVLARHEGIAGYPGEPKVEAQLWHRAQTLLPMRAVEAYTQGMMDLGATVCTRRAPRCDACPVAGDCIALRDGRIDELPGARPRKPLPKRAVCVLLIERAGTLLLEKRPGRGIWAGLWSLPEVAVDADVAQHCRKRFGARVVAGERLAAIEHAFTHFELTLHPQRVAVRTWPARTDAADLLWLTQEDALAAALPAPIRALLRLLDPRRHAA